MDLAEKDRRLSRLIEDIRGAISEAGDDPVGRSILETLLEDAEALRRG